MKKFYFVMWLIALVSIPKAYADTITQLTNGDCSPAIVNAKEVSIVCTFNHEEFKSSAILILLQASQPATQFEVVNTQNIKSVQISLDGQTYYELRSAPYVMGIKYWEKAVDFSINNVDLLTSTGTANVAVYFRGCSEKCSNQLKYSLPIDVAKELSDSTKLFLSQSPEIRCLDNKRYVATVLEVAGFEGIEMMGYSLRPKSEFTTWFEIKDNVAKIIHGDPVVSPARNSLVVPPGTARVYLTVRFVDGTYVRDFPVIKVDEQSCRENASAISRQRRR
jgi:hypothetical protein